MSSCWTRTISPRCSPAAALAAQPCSPLARPRQASAVGATARGFELDTANTAGIVALVYRPGASPEVWFQDLSCNWNFVAASFTDYVRLMMHHLGLPSWQYAFTEAGLDPLTRVRGGS